MKQKILFSTLFAVVLGLFVAVTPVKADEKCNSDESNAVASIMKDGENKYCSTLKDAVDDAEANSTITLLKDVELSSNVGINKSLTIDGKNFAIKPTSEWKNQGIISGDQSLITVSAPGDVILQNVALKDSKKYGAQAFNGGKLTLENVTVSGCGYGAILANGGIVTVKNVTLGKNGADKNVGIEIAKNDSTYSNPELIMDGIISINITM